MYAAHGDHPHCVNELLIRGADLTLKNINDDSALGIAINKGSTQGMPHHIENWLCISNTRIAFQHKQYSKTTSSVC
jgi:ankyrin repeat protein